MNDEKLMQERRKEKRFRMRDGTYAFLRASANKTGQVIDLSRTGLAFSYSSHHGIPVESRGLLDLMAEEGVLLERISYITINDCLINCETFFVPGITLRRRCVKFDTLSPEGILSIQSIIERFGRILQ
ncbi:MAG: hypothetical protein HY885_09290 [Deltaproteobacteria bacterium]|nr:hypothetical protein [Deltaproteobacteria bacterium]